MSAIPTLSAELAVAVKDFDRVIPAGKSNDRDIVAFRKRLLLLCKLARNLESEVQIYRLMEAAKQGRDVIEQLATEVAAAFVLSRDDNVIRPDFGRKA
ncbi:hypothetical protein B5K08_15975 [Rhizobium leguminosarum bv. trifolii]|uniref:Uncharacterized protein n=1 Tax=Rhizobium leguminosarum bv. trifolii TaxID=386 RepID=A0A3E1BGT3_RHILT|nr:hypothetical protein [Rhizobium leguminosarum]RFB91792.1 hypothetical protein B5K08_15975 [Rhizobium leguminosarum bv. trifolii]RFB92309.1 hypothetical protein B5K10_15970 [Rhizobium leguminosarum bv. trifolii]